MRKFLLTTIFILLLSKTASQEKIRNLKFKDTLWRTSWYGSQFDGKPMANGQRFDMNSLVAAHKDLPFGTKLKITNFKNGKSANVTVKDRGPFIAGRDLDVSYGTAKKLGFVNTGVADMKVEILEK